MRSITLGVLLLAAVVTAILELLLQPFYYDAVPIPLGTLLVLVIMPFLVRGAGDVSPAPVVAAAPLVVWGFVVLVVGLAGPGGDVLLPITWQTGLLLVSGLLAGLVPLRGVVERGYSSAAEEEHG
jgi:hypothetical protein